MKQNIIKPFSLRMPHFVRKWVTNRSAMKDRSMNAEINRILKKAKRIDEIKK